MKEAEINEHTAWLRVPGQQEDLHLPPQGDNAARLTDLQVRD